MNECVTNRTPLDCAPSWPVLILHFLVDMMLLERGDENGLFCFVVRNFGSGDIFAILGSCFKLKIKPKLYWRRNRFFYVFMVKW